MGTEIGGLHEGQCRAVFQLRGTVLGCGLGGCFVRRLYGSRRTRPFRAFVQLNDARIGNFPAEGFHITLMLVVLFEKYRFS